MPFGGLSPSQRGTWGFFYHLWAEGTPAEVEGQAKEQDEVPM